MSLCLPFTDLPLMKILLTDYLNIFNMIRLHSLVLIVCSCIGFVGHYIQYGVARLTPWIPATIGIFIFLFSYRVRKENGIMKYLPIVPVFIFGVVTTIMCARFLPQEFQPVRKKIIF